MPTFFSRESAIILLKQNDESPESPSTVDNLSPEFPSETLSSSTKQITLIKILWTIGSNRSSHDRLLFSPGCSILVCVVSLPAIEIEWSGGVPYVTVLLALLPKGSLSSPSWWSASKSPLAVKFPRVALRAGLHARESQSLSSSFPSVVSDNRKWEESNLTCPSP